MHEIWGADATYTDPNVHAVGMVELLTHIYAVVTRRPDTTVIRVGEIDTHHNFLRFGWRVMQADGTTLLEGVDFAEFSADRKLLRVVEFFNP